MSELKHTDAYVKSIEKKIVYLRNDLESTEKHGGYKHFKPHQICAYIDFLLFFLYKDMPLELEFLATGITP
jgi:hypothetical protein